MSHPESEHGYKPYAKPAGIFIGLLVLWAVSGTLIYGILKAFGAFTE